MKNQKSDEKNRLDIYKYHNQKNLGPNTYKYRTYNRMLRVSLLEPVFEKYHSANVR